jgi:hypothetical protein
VVADIDQRRHEGRQRQDRGPRVQGKGIEDRQRRRAQGAERGDARHREDQDPGQGRQHADRPGGGQEHAEEGRHALAALKSQPDRKQVAHEGRGPRQHVGVMTPEAAGDQDRDQPLAAVAQKRQQRQILAARTQHIGRADIAGADLAQVAHARGPGDQHAKGDGAQQIAQRRGGQQDEGAHA